MNCDSLQNHTRKERSVGMKFSKISRFVSMQQMQVQRWGYTGDTDDGEIMKNLTMHDSFRIKSFHEQITNIESNRCSWYCQDSKIWQARCRPPEFQFYRAKSTRLKLQEQVFRRYMILDPLVSILVNMDIENKLKSIQCWKTIGN